MAKDKLVEAAMNLGYDIKIETRGALTSGTLSEKDIDGAEAVVIAADIDIDKTQFNNKKIYYSNTNDAIRDPKTFIKNALSAKVYHSKTFQKKSKLEKVMSKNYISHSIFESFNKLLPFLGIIILFQAIPYIILFLIQHHEINTNNRGMINAMYDFSSGASTIFVAFVALLIALKIGGKPAMPGALLGSFFLNNPNFLGTAWNHPASSLNIQGNIFTGLIWAIIIGIIVGHLCRMMRYIKWHKSIQSIEGFLIIPIVTTFISFLITTYLFGNIAFAMCTWWANLMTNSVVNISVISVISISFILGTSTPFKLFLEISILFLKIIHT